MPPIASTTRIAKNHITGAPLPHSSASSFLGQPLVAGRDHHGHRLVDVVGELELVDVALLDRAPLERGVAQPAEQPGPVRRAEEHDRERRDLPRLREGERLEELVQRAEATGQHDEALAVLDEHRLAGEEVAEVDPDVGPLVEPRLEGQLDAQPDADAAGLAGALVGGLHRARAAAGDHREPGLDQSPADRLRLVVRLVAGVGARRPEHGDRRPELGQRPEPLDELRLDPHHPPRIRVDPVGGTP
jgi:hypothetical protein